MELDRRHPRLPIVAALAAAAILLVALSAASSARAAAGDPLLPNLVTLNIGHDDLVMEQPHNRPLLGLSNEVANLGQGPLEIFASPTSNNCDGDSNPDNDRDAFQRIYRDDGDGVFDRSLDTGSDSYKIGCERESSQYYWQVWNLARYKLLRESDGKAVAKRQKVAYCTVDSAFHRHFHVPGQSKTGYYPDGGCAPDGVLGISVGWADLYTYFIPTQLIDVSGVKTGPYCLRSIADPRNLIQETDDSDNVLDVPVFVNPAKLTVKRLDGDCELPA
jgi:hypothetical protein